MRSPVKAITRLYDHEDHAHEIRAAVMDGLDAMVSLVVLVLVVGTAINYIGDRHRWSTVDRLGYSHVDLSFDRWALLMIGFIGLLGFALSLLAITSSSYKSRPEPKRRPLGRTVLALLAAVALSIGLNALLSQAYNLDVVIWGLVYFLPATVPAAMRLTTKEAFTYKVLPSPAASRAA